MRGFQGCFSIAPGSALTFSSFLFHHIKLTILNLLPFSFSIREALFYHRR
jgi:hypothetical protein